jgi:HCO3- transporter family
MLGITELYRLRFICILRSMLSIVLLGLFGRLTCQFSILPALAFSLDMFEKTNQSYGVNEVLLASVLGSVVFSIAAAQPLVIVGVTGRFLVRGND